MHAADRIVSFRFGLSCPLLARGFFVRLSPGTLHFISSPWSPLECFGPLKVFRASFGVHACICMIDDVMDHLISRNATDAEARAALAFSSSNVLQFQHML